MAKRKMVYVVVENTPGYLPDSEPASFVRKQDALDHMRDLAEELREDGYKVRGSMREGGYYGERHSNDLGRVIELSEYTPEEAAAMGYEIEDE